MSSTTDLQPKSAAPPRRPAPLTLELSPLLYTAAWLFIVVFHTACGSFLICVAMTYWYLTTDTLPFYASIWSLKGIENYKFYGFVFGTVGAMHGVRVLTLVLMSVRARHFTLRSETSVIRTLVSRRMMTGRWGRSDKDVTKGSEPTTGQRGKLHALAVIWNSVFSRQGFFGVESEHFFLVSAFREVLEASSQTYQAYRASNLLPRAELNTLMVGLLITNCWTTAGIIVFVRKSPAMQRVCTLTYDAIISFGMLIVVPLIIFVPYIRAFNFEYNTVKDPDFMYTPVTLVSLVLENRLIFAASLFDFATKLIPQLSIMLSLVTVSELLGRGDVKVIPGGETPSIQSVAVKPRASRLSFLKAPNTQNPTANPQSPSQWAGLQALLKWKHAITVAVFVLWGLIVLLLHIAAAHRAWGSEVLGCRAMTRPWFSNGKEPCASLVYDCHNHNTASLDQTSFDTLDHDVLATLSIAHCPGLEMPSDFQRLKNLVSLHIYNSTIVDWDVSSSVSATAHTRLLAVLVGRTHMKEVPQGILQPLPASLMAVQFSHTNLKTIPDDLYMRWHAMAVIGFEFSELTQIPYQMFFSPVYTLALAGNQIESIPTLAMMPPGMIIPQLRLAHNPLKELPAALMDPTPFIFSMSVENTSLTAMPAWIKTNTKVVWASETPFCAAPMADPTLAYQVMCFPRPAGQENYFPMYLFDSLYAYEG